MEDGCDPKFPGTKARAMQNRNAARGELFRTRAIADTQKYSMRDHTHAGCFLENPIAMYCSASFESVLSRPQPIARAVQRYHEDPTRDELPTIYRVPPEILSSNIGNAHKHAYSPKAVCIGPYCSDTKNQGLKSMQDHKRACVNKLASKYGRTDLEEDFFDKCLMRMKELEGPVRRSYSEDISWLSSEELVLMLVLDGCFILNLLLKHRDKNSKEEETDEDDCRKVVGRLWMWELVKYDLLLLENQIPFFVIQELYQILKTSNDDSINLVECAFWYFKGLDPSKKEQPPAFISSLPADNIVHHLLHLTYKLFLQHVSSHVVNFSEPKSSQQWIPSATELEAAGVKFKKRKDASSFLDIKFSFSSGEMEIPHLEVHDFSESLFRNLIAFEQSYPYRDNDFVVTAYATFMNCLVDTQNDLRLLHLNGILTFRMTGDKDAVHFFSRLCDDVAYPKDRNYLDGVFQEVTAYMGLKLHRWRADLRLKYFSSPWSTIVVVVAALTFLLTLIQAIFAVLSYFWPRK